MSDSSNNALPAGYELDEYTIESVLGHGGFGITYLANDKQLGTRVAIKEYFPGSLATRNEQWHIHCRNDIGATAQQTFAWGLNQFLREARALGQFKHHNIVRVLRFLEANGTAYMVMEYESGQSLTRQLLMSGNRLAEPALLRVFIPILNGLQAVHAVGLLHRDIKPDNIYLRTDVSPMLIDFGSVQPTTKMQGDAQPITLTPSYAAIEQYPDQGPEGPWTDIYAIGASMHRCITGSPPTGGFERYDAICTYKPDPATPLAQIRPEGYADYVLDCVDWAMQLYARNRPQSARDLQDALMGKRKADTVAQSKPVMPPPPPVRHDKEFVEQRPTTVDHWKMVRWGIAGLVAIISVAIFFAYPTGNTKKQAAIESEAVSAGIATTTLPGIETGSFIAVRRLTGSAGSVDAVAFVPGSDKLLSATRGGELKIWDINSGNVIASLKRHGHNVNALLALGRDSLIAAGDEGGTILIWDATRNRVADHLVGHSAAVKALAIEPGRQWLASAGRDGRVMMWNLRRAGENRVLAANLGRIDALAMSPDGKQVAAGTVRGEVHVIDTKSGTVRWTLKDVGGMVKAVAFSPDGRWLAAGGLSNGIAIWSTTTGAVERKLVPERPGVVNTLHFSRNGRWLFSGDAAGVISIWDINTGVLANSGYEHQGPIRDLALSADGKTLASASGDKTVILWALN